MRKIHMCGLLGAVLLLAGCLMGPNYKQPELDLPTGQAADNFSIFTNAQWWTVFDDEVLNQLETEALAYNKDLQAAVARVDEARAAVGIATADQLPSLSAAAQSGRAGSKAGSGESQSTANVSVSFELDLWGKYRRLSEAARAQLLASEAARDTVRLTLTADVAKNYFALRMLDAQLEIAQRTLKARQENVRIYTSRYKNGYSTEVDLKRVEANMASVQAQEQQLRLKISQTETALSVLVGKSPRQIAEGATPRGKKLAEITLIPNVPEGLPSDLLARRPDVRSAEGSLIAANANIGAARAAYFPSIPLTASAGYASGALNNLFTGSSGVWAIGGQLLAPIFEGGKIRAQNKQAEAQYREMLATYEKTVQGAFKETLDALSANRINREIFESYNQQTVAMQRSYDLTKKQEDAGLIGVTDLLSVEENLLSAEMNLASARNDELAAVVNLSKALGGGWNVQDGFGPYENLVKKQQAELKK
ncbi:MAG: efflux transporter outer membrane subunit [Elusimicrobia bacterium]|nr:efflux transporter outer membrane subunit [Elusimicrobiota bacterium]MDY5729363.1 efflux transporter outer membrane subunit [Elusimicrobiaceae bacterium]